VGDESNKELKKNVYLFMAMVLMKAAYHNDTETIREIFDFWHERGISDKMEVVLFYLVYISKTHDISSDKLKKMLEESKIEGGEIMPTLAQQFKEEFKEEFMQTMGPQLKNEGKIEEKKETAKQMLLDNLPIEQVMKYTGLTEKEVKALMQ